MANLKEVRERISSVKNTQQITKAMKLVAASKLRRAQQAITQMRPYADKLDEILRNILSNLEGDVSSSFGVERPAEKICLVVITSNRGLCGAFNTNVIKAARKALDEKYAEQAAAGHVSILAIGKKGSEAFGRSEYASLVDNRFMDLAEDLSADNIARVSKYLMDEFSNENFDLVDVAYARFRNAAVQYFNVVQFLPIAKIEVAEDAAPAKANYIFEPEKESLLNHLIPSILQTSFQKFVFDSNASEHGARMTAMDSATENANELLRELKITYNKARQESITNEILEIVSGAAALENG